MTDTEAMDQFDRLLAVCVHPPDPAAAFREWALAFQASDVEDVREGITRLLAAKVDRFMPSPGELRGAIASVQSGREPVGCRRCGGSRWVEARPYKANGTLVYEGVRRCPACGVPAPTLAGESHQTPLTDREEAAWRAARRPAVPVATLEEYHARVSALQARYTARRMPAVEVV